MTELSMRIVKLIIQRVSARDIAERVGCHPAHVYTVASRYRISLKTGRSMDIPDRDARIIALRAQRKTPAEIMAELGVTRSAVRFAVHRHLVQQRGAEND